MWRLQRVRLMKRKKRMHKPKRCNTAMVSLEKVLPTKEQETTVDKAIWHRGQADEAVEVLADVPEDFDTSSAGVWRAWYVAVPLGDSRQHVND